MTIPCNTCGGTGKIAMTVWISDNTSAADKPSGPNVWTDCHDCKGWKALEQPQSGGYFSIIDTKVDVDKICDERGYSELTRRLLHLMQGFDLKSVRLR